jgi:hypothetical protein
VIPTPKKLGLNGSLGLLTITLFLVMVAMLSTYPMAYYQQDIMVIGHIFKTQLLSRSILGFMLF